MRSAVLLVLVLVCLSGCGGGDGASGSPTGTAPAEVPAAAIESTNFDFQRVERCMRQAPTVTETLGFEDGNQLARPAGEGEFRAKFKRNEVNIAFERNERDAQAREADLREFNEIWDEGYQPELVARRGNAVWEWSVTPTADEAGALEECLARAGS